MVGSDVVRARGGDVVRIPLVAGRSTSAILERVRRL
jgi:bifunctional ADP-heptose synthase (sugar kinase/adenylyltransferase)